MNFLYIRWKFLELSLVQADLMDRSDERSDFLQVAKLQARRGERPAGRAQLLAKKGASGRMQRPPELVPIPECCLNAA